jgi:hypothetical protein
MLQREVLVVESSSVDALAAVREVARLHHKVLNDTMENDALECVNA